MNLFTAFFSKCRGLYTCGRFEATEEPGGPDLIEDAAEFNAPTNCQHDFRGCYLWLILGLKEQSQGSRLESSADPASGRRAIFLTCR